MGAGQAPNLPRATPANRNLIVLVLERFRILAVW
jgi:hypothetical protein